jgi:protein-S-isoprenylcysteine O-methyltransferase Ste14
MLKLPPPVWALIYIVIAGIVSALYPWRAAIVDLRVLWLGIFVTLAGFALAVSAATLFRRRGTDINPTSETNKLLVIDGPYRFTRNPMYLGLTVFTLGIAFCVGSLPMFAVPILLFLTATFVHIPFEEAKMRRQFGAAFDGYTDRVRRWI